MTVSALAIWLALSGAANMVLDYQQQDAPTAFGLDPQYWWVYLLLIPAANWASQNLFPWLRGTLDAEFKARRDRSTRDAHAYEERFLVALEQSAKAQDLSARASIDVAAALQALVQVRVADNLTLQRIERRTDRIWEVLEVDRKADE